VGEAGGGTLLWLAWLGQPERSLALSRRASLITTEKYREFESFVTSLSSAAKILNARHLVKLRLCAPERSIMKDISLA
jgi:hypothetical protein